MRVTSIKLDLKGINTVMTSTPVQQIVDAAGSQIAAKAGTGFEYTSGPKHRWVARGYVNAATFEARKAEAQNRALTRAVGR
ncbi:MAG: hypothetical protein LBH11_03360 [Propionibacteriaceae bacterium]|jgi:hypothetical protein|nr:hypothetical protein [Propionibacteriaceae bacterium]